MAPKFIPRPARLELRIDGASAWVLRLENDQARHLSRRLKEYTHSVLPLLLDEGTPRDEDVADGLIALLDSEIFASRAIQKRRGG